MKKLRVTVGIHSYSVEVSDPRESPLTVIVDGERFRVEVQEEEDNGVSPAPSAEPSTPELLETPKDAETPVTAPMPGTVLDIAVQVGTQVEKDQVLCTLEAMKMKTPLRAQHAGVVRQVQVHDGQTVEHGDPLFVLG